VLKAHSIRESVSPSWQAKKFTETLIKGDPREGRVIAGTARQVLESILPGADRDNG
jgi:pyruvate dehydrogenase (quinone)